MTTPVVPIDALPTPPSTSDTVNFDPRADAFLGQLPDFATQANAAALATYENAVHAEEQAVIAQNAAAAAVGSASAPIWSAGTFALGDVRSSPSNGRIYRCILAGSSISDPSLDATRWKLVVVTLASLPVFEVSTTTKSAEIGVHYLLTNASSSTMFAPAAPVPGSVWRLSIGNGRIDNVINWNGLKHEGISDAATVLDSVSSWEFQYMSTSFGWKVNE